MTHDELLAKIDSLTYMLMENEVPSGYKALRAVVELHKPHKFLNNKTQQETFNCSVCLNRPTEQWQPCPTIQVIAKELK